MRRYKEATILAILNAIDYKINRISLIMKYLNLSGTSARNYLGEELLGLLNQNWGDRKN